MSSSYGVKAVPGSRNHTMPNHYTQMEPSAQSLPGSSPRRMLLFIPAYPNMAPPSPNCTFVPLNKLPPHLRQMAMPSFDPRMMGQMIDASHPLQQAKTVRSSPANLGTIKETREPNEPDSVSFPPISKNGQQPLSRRLSNLAEHRQNWRGLRRIDIERNNSLYNDVPKFTPDPPAPDYYYPGISNPRKERGESFSEIYDAPKPASRTQPSARILELAKPRVRKVEEYVKSYTSPKSAPKLPLSLRMEELAKPKDYKPKETTKPKSASKNGAGGQEGSPKGKKKKSVKQKG